MEHCKSVNHLLDQCTDYIAKIFNEYSVSQLKYAQTERVIDDEENKKMNS